MNGQNGVLIPSCNSDILASEIVQMLVDEETRSRLGMNGLKWVRQFDYPMLVLKYEQLLKKFWHRTFTDKIFSTAVAILQIIL